MASLADSALDLQAIRDHERSELIEILEMHHGNKHLVLDTQLSSLLSHILADASKVLQENGVVQVSELGADLAPTRAGKVEPDHVLFFVRPSVQHMKAVARQIFDAREHGLTERFFVYFAPHKTLICEQVLEDEGVLEYVELGEYQLNLIPLDTDLVSLELDRSFRECKLEGDTSSLQAVTQSLMKLQSFCGLIPNVKSVGPLGRTVCSKLMRMRVESGEADEATTPTAPQIDTLWVFDREVDLATPLVTPLTYEGLIDELIGIRHSFIKVDRRILGDDKNGPGGAGGGGAAAAGADGGPGEEPADTAPVSIALNSNDKLYHEIRDMNIERLGPCLGQKAKEIRGSYDTFRSNKDATINEIHDFVKQIPGLTQIYKSLNQHINITEEIKRTTDGSAFRQRWNTERALLEGETCFDLIEEMIAVQEPQLQVLRLLCLQSITSGGLRSNKFDLLRREIVQTYGYETLFTLNNLERIGMLRRREMQLQWMDSSSTWGSVRRALALINEEVNVVSPNDIAYVSSGYAPLSVRLLQAAVKPGWSAYATTLQLLPRPAIEFTQQAKPEELTQALARSVQLDRTPQAAAASSAAAADGAALANHSQLSAGGAGPKKIMAAYFVGGVTFLEVAALRFLSQQPDFPFRIIVFTTKLINGSTFVKSLVHDMDVSGQRDR